ncbi:MAG: phenylalanine--tRNA ligase subunit beta [Oscillospiraceae bacterium]|nr:phenylalanine--tRNA ligase subunit beta [Oscillospiraceae bacterium]MCL2279515.1 phenylalanine--tRNA ligase subunit beta [Oscillospiraceae bacterium]
MKISLNWLRDYVEIPEDLELSRLAHDITMATVEVESMTELARQYDNMIVGVVCDILPHPDKSKSGAQFVCNIDVGNQDMCKIVCGGINLRKGMRVAVALPGAMVRWHGIGDPTKVECKKIYGVESYGMICASPEAGLSDLFPYREEATIIDLSEFEVPPGTPLASALGLEDVILEIDNKSLTNRPDLWGHYGIAREISAIYDVPLIGFEPFKPPLTPDFEVAIEDLKRCPRYTGVKIENLSVKPAPFGIQSRLWRVGMRPINAIVDITNYVLLATGQPTHAFDSDKIEGHITVRRAFDKEKLLLLDGKELVLTTEDLVIADDEGAVGLAGVMGGEKDSVLPNTSGVILEIANFDAIGIRKTSMRHEVRTESSARYDKGIDPERADITLSIAMHMFADFYPDMVVTGFHDNYPEHLEVKKINISLRWLEKRLGKHISNEDIATLLVRLGFDVGFEGDNMHIVAPTWRSMGDISIPDDIMEEIARMHGYENFAPTPIHTSFEEAINQPKVYVDRRMREYLAFTCGMDEIFTYPWVGDEYIGAILGSSDGMLSLVAPPSPSERFIRNSLLPNLCKAVSGNLRHFNEFGIFESAQVFYNRDFEAVYDLRESLPQQVRNIAGAFAGASENVNTLFRKAKGVIEALPRYLHVEPITFERNKKPVWADNVAWLNICHNCEVIGNVALLSRKASRECKFRRNAAAVLFELAIDALKPLPSRTNEYTHLPDYPVTEYDISMLFDATTKWQDIYAVIIEKKSDTELLHDVSFVDEYKGKQVPVGKKSITFRLRIGSLQKTLKAEEIEGCANVVEKILNETFGANLRRL